jgi:hypothetical protein
LLPAKNLPTGVSIHLGVANRESVLEQLTANRIDLAIMGQRLERVAIRIMDNPLVAIATPDHPFVQQKKVALRDLASEPFLVREAGSGRRAAMTRFFAGKGLEIHPRLEPGSNEAIKQAILAGLGLSAPPATPSPSTSPASSPNSTSWAFPSCATGTPCIRQGGNCRWWRGRFWITCWGRGMGRRLRRTSRNFESANVAKYTGASGYRLKVERLAALFAPLYGANMGKTP